MHQPLCHILLLAEVVHGHLIAGAVKVEHLVGAHSLHGALHPVGLHFGHQRVQVIVLLAGDDAVHDALDAEDPGQGPGVDVLDAGDAVADQVVVQSAGAAEIAASGGQVTDHQRLRPGMDGLVVLVVGTIVADEGIGHYHALPGIGGIGQNFLVAHH